MPWEAASGNIYKLCLLDTNALSEIVKNPTKEGRGFKKNFGPGSYAPCLTVYNLIELRRKEKIFEAFLDFFSKYPNFLLKSMKQIVEEEFISFNSRLPLSPLLNSFSPVGQNSSYMLKDFIDKFFINPEIGDLEKKWRSNEEEILSVWLENKRNFNPERLTANAVDAERYVKEAGIQTLIHYSPERVQNILKKEQFPNLSLFPSISVMLYSQYYRFFDPKRKFSSQDVTDIMIIAVAPYIDAIVTEKFQAEIFKKIKKRIPQLKNLEVATLSDLRKSYQE
jgi:hypothetical protein